jgi:hypothetical protein
MNSIKEVVMTDNTKRILEMLAEKKISVDEAQRLIELVEPENEAGPAKEETDGLVKSLPKYLRVMVEPAEGNRLDSGAERVNIRVPVALIRAGMKLTSLIPAPAVEKANAALKENGIDMDLNKIKGADIEPLIEALSELEIDVDGKEKVHVFME